MRALFFGLLLAFSLFAAEGVVTLESRYGAEETTRRLVQALRQKGLTLFKVIDHAEGAKKAGGGLAPMKLVIFGNPKMGTPFLRCAPTMGIDLPQKMLIYENEKGKTVVVYNDPDYLFARHGIDANCSAPLQAKMKAALRAFAEKAAGLR